MQYEIILSGSAGASTNMAIDARLLESLAEDKRCILRLYDWDCHSATYGYFLDPYQYLKRDAGIHLARRPTGGGILFHHTDLTFSICIPQGHPGYSTNTLENYAFINGAILDTVQKFLGERGKPALLPFESEPSNASCLHFCMAQPTKYDVIVDERKVGGGAQRRTRHGFLHQGTIAIALPSEKFLKQVLLPDTGIAEAMLRNSYSFLGNHYTEKELFDARKTMREFLMDAVKKRFK